MNIHDAGIMAAADAVAAIVYGVVPSGPMDIEVAKAAIEAYQATVTPEVKWFINQRPEYIQALRGTRGTDDQTDYYRWQGHAEARRQLAQRLGCTVPSEPGETMEFVCDTL